MVDEADLDNAELAVEGVGIGVVYGEGEESITAVDDIDIALRTGRFTSILGPSGCGKSTLLMALAGLLGTSSGTVLARGRPVTGPYDGLGVAFQRDLLVPWRTVTENVLLQVELMGRRKRDYAAYCRDLLETVGLSKFGDRFPQELSGGMRQRVALCRALIHGPSVLLMDEPFGALDQLTREQIHVDVDRICSQTGAAVALVTHSIDEAAFLSDEVMVMTARPGRVKQRLSVDLTRPRTHELRLTSEYAEVVHSIRAALEEDDMATDPTESGE